MITAAPGNELIAMDFSAVEARVLAWLAGEEKVLDIFRTHGKIYEHAAAGIFGKSIEKITKDERQIGKVAVLALGYQGGVGAFQSMANIYGVQVEDTRADNIKKAWRNSHKNIVTFWHDLEHAAINAVLYEGKVFTAGAQGREVRFKKDGSILICQLPSKRKICYPFATVRETETQWGDLRPTLFYYTSFGTNWTKISGYGGLLCENVTQGAAACLLRGALIRLEEAGYPVVFHAHDEAVVEIPETAPASAIKEVEELMAVVPDWAEGLPLAAEGWRGKRYRK
jgi:DNA polymerase